MPVTIAPSTRAKLMRITARDLHPPLHDPLKTLAEMLTSTAALRPSSGRFWDSDSDLECEDLGDAEAHHPPVPSSSAPPLQRAPAGVAPSTVLSSARIPATPPHRAKPPWKSMWKGPLPPATFSPPTTLWDFLPPALRAAGERGAATATDAFCDPVSTLI
jgi:hypothetical protein